MPLRGISEKSKLTTQSTRRKFFYCLFTKIFTVHILLITSEVWASCFYCDASATTLSEKCRKCASWDIATKRCAGEPIHQRWSKCFIQIIIHPAED